MNEAGNNASTAKEGQLTPDLLALRERHPRDVWPSLPRGSLPSVWLSMHDSLRQGQEMLERLATHWQLKMIDDATFRDRALPILRHHLGHLHGHHRLEDTHYFPQFRSIQPRLVKGFDLLERDHADLNAAIDALEDLTRHLSSLDAHSPDAGAHIQRMADALHRIGPNLREHLQDEEDLVIPLLADAQSTATNE